MCLGIYIYIHITMYAMYMTIFIAIYYVQL